MQITAMTPIKYNQKTNNSGLSFGMAHRHVLTCGHTEEALKIIHWYHGISGIRGVFIGNKQKAVHVLYDKCSEAGQRLRQALTHRKLVAREFSNVQPTTFLRECKKLSPFKQSKVDPNKRSARINNFSFVERVAGFLGILM